MSRRSRFLIFSARRCASGTPRRRMPMNANLSRSSVRSRISCANRTRVRSISEALISCFFSRVRGMAGKRSSVTYGRLISLQSAVDTAGQLLNVLGLLDGLCGDHLRVFFIKLGLHLLGQAKQFGGVLDVPLVIRLDESSALLVRQRNWLAEIRTTARNWRAGRNLPQTHPHHCEHQE